MKTKLNQSKLKLAIVSAMLVGSAGFSAASYASTDMDVSTLVGEACLVSIATSMGFADYAPLTTHSGADLIKDSTISAHCTLDTTATISLSVGLNPVAPANTAAPVRRMSNGATGLLAYNLYRDPARTVIWGAGSGNGASYTGTGSSTDVLIFGKIGAGLVVPNGTYTDTVTVSIELG
jgi:spore coat protein U-like protein